MAASARKNQASCLPTGVPGRVLDTNTDGSAAAAVGRGSPLRPGEPEHPAATTAITTPNKAHKTRPAAARLAGCPALARALPPGEVT
jgi:hypothetical protein